MFNRVFTLVFLRCIGVFDDSAFLKIGELILDELVPSRDIFDNKPPGIYYLGAAIAAISNRHWLAPPIFLFVFAAVFGVIVIKYTRKYWGSLAAYLVAWIFGLSYTIAQGYSFHTDQFCAFFGIAAIAAISGDSAKLLTSGTASGAIIEIPVNQEKPLNNYQNYQLIQPSDSIKQVQKPVLLSCAKIYI